MITRVTYCLLAVSLACCSVGCSSLVTHVKTWPVASFYSGTQRSVNSMVEHNRFVRYFGRTQQASQMQGFLFLDLVHSAALDTVLLPVDAILWPFWGTDSGDSSDPRAERVPPADGSSAHESGR